MADHHEYCNGGFSPDDIVISGISGRFPMCKSVSELNEGLLIQKDFLVQNNDRFEKGAADLPFSSFGTLDDVDKFDREFFGFSPLSANYTDPQQRILMEVTYEALVDSGYDPQVEMRGRKIGIYTAVTNEDAKSMSFESNEGTVSGQYATGFLRCMLANRISHIFDFQGPSSTVDTACSTSFAALRMAYIDMRDGVVEAAVVNGAQLCFYPLMHKLYKDSGIVSDTAESNPFDVRANGIARTEAVTAVFLQKASAARRVYATLVSINTATCGHVPEGVYVPSFKTEVKLFQDTLREAKLDTNDIQYIECHGTGTQVGDPIEIRAIETVYCKGRTTPLTAGSIKSSLGHSEGPAGQCGIIKVIFAFETGIITPNQDFQIPNPSCEAIINGKIKIVTEPLPLKSDYVPINCFGFGGAMFQAILKKNPIEPSSSPESPYLPRLVLYSATTEAAVLYVFDYIESHPELTKEFFALLNKLSFTPAISKPFRGYALFQNVHPVLQIKNVLRDRRREVWFVMTGMGCQWPGMGLQMMQVKVFADSMKKSAAVLKPLGLDLFELLRKDGSHLTTDRSITPAFVTIAAIQVALIDVLKALKIQPDHMIGHSAGEILCAYADGCFSAEQTILSSYWRGRSVESAGLEEGRMAAIGLTWEEAVRRCPKGVYAACHNAEDSVTISGLKEPVEKFVAELQQQNIFARVVNAYGFGFHCEHVWPATKSLKKALLDLIPNPQSRTKRWISTSYPVDEWDKEDCKLAGAEYFVHNLMSPVLFQDALEKIPPDAITIEIGPHFLLQSILKRSIGSDAVYVGLMKRNDSNNVGFLLESLGKLYVEGLDPKIENLYQPVKFPVPRTTPMICDLIRWNHSESYEIPIFKTSKASFEHTFNIGAGDGYLLDHFINGRSLFPATGYVFLAWKALCDKLDKQIEDMNVVLEDFKIHRATVISPKNITFSVTILDSTGSFEIMESKSLVASGRIYELKNMVFCESDPEVNRDSSTFVSGSDVYNEVRINGYQYGPAFQRLQEISLDGREGFVEFGDWISFMDALLLFYMCGETTSYSMSLPTGAHSFKISPSLLHNAVEDIKARNLPGVPVNFHPETQICRTVGLEIKRLEVDSAIKSAQSDDSILEEYKFIPYNHEFPISKIAPSVEKYMIACNKVINRLESNLKMDLHHKKFSYKPDIDSEVDGYVSENSKEHILLTVLEELASLKKTTDNQRCKTIFKEYIQSIGRDLSNSQLVNDYCLRYMFDIISENSFRKLSVLEINDNFVKILPTLTEVVEKTSMLKFKSKTLVSDSVEDSEKQELSDCKIEMYSCDALPSLIQQKKQDVVLSAISTGTIEEAQQHIRLLSSAVEQKGFILLYHKNSVLPPENLVASLCGGSISVVSQSALENVFQKEDLVVVSKIFDDVVGNLYLLRHTAGPDARKIITITEDGKWLNELKASVSASSETSWVVSQDDPCSGIIGMMNCLRNEPGGDRLRCVFIPEKSKEKISPPNFSFQDSFFHYVIKKDLMMNVYKDGRWGSYRHIRTEKEISDAVVDDCFLQIKKVGDLSSLTWMESPVNYTNRSDKELIHIYYSSLNFKDVMAATGKISRNIAHVELMGEKDEEWLLGLEFSGRNNLGERVFGFGKYLGNTTTSKLSIRIPDHWSMEEAATVPVVYATCFYGLIIKAGLKDGESILIHSGTGGIGIAAINIALSMNCEIYTTVGTEKKRQYLLKNFPSIKEENIGCSRNITFEDMIMKRTKSKGVNVVLNSLADDKLLASIRCLSKHGRFVEIGKYDLSLDKKIGLKFLLEDISFHGVFLDKVLAHTTNPMIYEILALLEKGIKDGVVKPLDRTVFQHDEVEKAFRFMGTGTHIGKILLKIRDEEKQKNSMPVKLRLPATPVTYFYSHKVYIIVGGLGGFGIEVSKWLLSKGARNLVLTTRYGARTSYHNFCLKRWQDKGYNVVVSTRDVSKKHEASELLKEVMRIGPVGGIFNSAVVLHDAFLENTNWDDFKEVCAPKADATKHLDALSRCFCPELDHFVCFSSISCGRGNAGQMNYGYANSVMERVCEQRRANGFPGLAIQWGIIGEVGVVHRHMGDDAMIAGVGAQKVNSCLNILDVSSQLKLPVVSSYAIKSQSRKLGDQGDIMQQLAKLFGLKDASQFNVMRSFSEMGLDSMIGIEVKHLLETTCDITLSMQEIQELKIADIKSLIEKMESEKMDKTPTLVSTLVCQNLPKSCVHLEAVQRLNDAQNGVPVFIIDIDSDDLSQLRNLSAAINQPVFALVLSKETPMTDIQSLASWYIDRIKLISRKEIRIIAHSSASVLALEMILQLQKSGNLGFTLVILSGSSTLMKIANNETKSSSIEILCDFVENYIPSSRHKVQDQLSNTTNLEQQVRCVVEFFTKSSSQSVDKTELSAIILSYVKKIELLEAYMPKEKLCGDILLIEDSTQILANDVAELKMLISQICSGKITIQRIPDLNTFDEESIQKMSSIMKPVLI